MKKGDGRIEAEQGRALNKSNHRQSLHAPVKPSMDALGCVPGASQKQMPKARSKRQGLSPRCCWFHRRRRCRAAGSGAPL